MTGFASSIEATKLDLAQNGSIQNMFSTNAKIEASIRATSPKTLTVTPYLWDSRNIYSKWIGRFSADAKPVLMRQVERRHKAGIGATG